MAIRCTSEQFAEAVLLWSVQAFGTPVLCKEREDAEDLKPLHLLLSTVEVFFDGFKDKFQISFDKNKPRFLLSKQSFINYLEPRCLLLASNNDCFDLMLTCTFVFDVILSLSCDGCFHFARVGCKLLAAVLEDKFSDIFNTDLGWEKLMSYCRKIHSAVFPSKANRPPGYFPTSEDSDDGDSSQNKDTLVGEEESTSNKELSKVELIQPNSHDSSGEDCDSKFHGETVSGEAKEENSVLFVNAPDTEGFVDNSDYWRFENMKILTVCERITESPNHLKDVLNVLEIIDQNMDPEIASLNKYDIPLCDDEDIEKLEREVFKPDMSTWHIKCSDGTVVDFATHEICHERNKELGDSEENRVRFEDITDEERLHFSEEFFGPEDEPECELCYGRKKAFYTNCLVNFKEKYTNCDLVSDD